MTSSFHLAASFLVYLTVPGSSTENSSVKPIPRKKMLKKKNTKEKVEGGMTTTNNRFCCLEGRENHTQNSKGGEKKKRIRGPTGHIVQELRV